MRLEFGEGHFDRVEVGRIGRQEQEPCAFGPDGLFGSLAFVRRKIVEDDDIARRQGRDQLRFDPCFENEAVDRSVDHPGRGEAVTSQPSDECLGVPVSERDQRLQPHAAYRTSALPGHVGLRPCLIHEHKPARLFSHARLPPADPSVARRAHVRTQRFAGQSGFFYS